MVYCLTCNNFNTLLISIKTHFQKVRSLLSLLVVAERLFVIEKRLRCLAPNGNYYPCSHPGNPKKTIQKPRGRELLPLHSFHFECIHKYLLINIRITYCYGGGGETTTQTTLKQLEITNVYPEEQETRSQLAQQVVLLLGLWVSRDLSAKLLSGTKGHQQA